MREDKLCPIEIEFSDKKQLAETLLDFPEQSKIVLILWKDMAGFLKIESVVEEMQKRYDLVWLDGNIANPTQKDVIDAVYKIGEQAPERIICIGGGSAIDTGKGISALFGYVRTSENEEENLCRVTEAIKTKNYVKEAQPIPIIAIPTTAGTGSEVTKWATIWDVNKEAKYSIDMNELYPAKAIICTDLTLTLPKKLVLSTALDAMAHAMEAFWAKPSTPVVRDIAETAVRKIHKNLPLALQDLTNYKIREELCRASLLAGIAFSNTRTTACHSISYPITMQFGVDHGYAVAMQLVEVTKINLEAVPEISILLDIFKEDGGLEQWMERISKDIQPLRLSAFGIKEEAIPGLVEASFTAGRMNNNPVDITPEQVEEILKKIL